MMINEDLFIDEKESELLSAIQEEIVFTNELSDYYIKYIEKRRIPDLLGKTVKISNNQFPKINNIIKDICNILELTDIDTFVYEDFYYGVEAKGISKNWLEVSAKTIADFTDEEITFLLAKELYSIKFKKTYYSILIDLYIKNVDGLIFQNIKTISEGAKVILYKWHRVMNFSSDNFALSVTGNLKSSIKAILLTILNNRDLVENVNINEYINQGKEIINLDDEVYNYTKLDELIPYGPFRINNLISYYYSDRAKEAEIMLKNFKI